MSKNLVVKDNALINASYNLDLIEQRLILLAIAQSRKFEFDISADRRVQIRVSDYINIYNIQGRSVYENVKNACTTLFERQFSYIEKQEKGVRVVKSRWISEIAYNDEQATIDFIFAPSVIPLISMLEKHFTSYELEQVANLNSKYAVRLYELLIAWRSQAKTPLISTESIRNRLGVQNNEYKLMGDFKKRVMDLSIKEINEKTDIQVIYEQHKAGRKIIGFTFKIKKKTKENEQQRDKNKLDMPSPVKMTDKQRSFFASKLAHDEPKCSQLPYGNESYEALARWIEKDLLKPERAEFYRPLLIKHGFKE